MDWTVVGLAAVLGVAAILIGVTTDRRNRRRRAELEAGAPERNIPAYPADAPAPAYVSAEAANTPPASPRPAAARLDESQADVRIAAGWTDRRFVTADDLAVLRPACVVVADAVMSVREVLPLIEKARRLGVGLALVTGDVEPDVRETLAVNVVQRLQEVVVVIATAEQRTSLTTALGSRSLDRTALQSGWVPDDATPKVDTWVSGPTSSWATRAATPAA